MVHLDGGLLNDFWVIKLLHPNRLKNEPKNGPKERLLFCVPVASNKALAINYLSNQYQALVGIIDWHE